MQLPVKMRWKLAFPNWGLAGSLGRAAALAAFAGESVPAQLPALRELEPAAEQVPCSQRELPRLCPDKRRHKRLQVPLWALDRLDHTGGAW